MDYKQNVSKYVCKMINTLNKRAPCGTTLLKTVKMKVAIKYGD